jgi:hypothetical protein
LKNPVDVVIVDDNIIFLIPKTIANGGKNGFVNPSKDPSSGKG